MTDDIRGKLEAMSDTRIGSAYIPGVGEIYFKSLNERQRADIEVSVRDDERSLRARLMTACLTDENGNRLYSDSDEDIETIMNMDHAIVVTITDHINDHIAFRFFEEGVGEAAKN